jgi:hypothetical protein
VTILKRAMSHGKESTGKTISENRGLQISRQSAHEGREVVSPTYQPFFYHGARAPVDQEPLVIKDSSHSGKPKSKGLLWTSDQPDANTSTSQRTTLTTDRHPCPQRDSNLQFQQASGRKTTP